MGQQHQFYCYVLNKVIATGFEIYLALKISSMLKRLNYTFVLVFVSLFTASAIAQNLSDKIPLMAT